MSDTTTTSAVHPSTIGTVLICGAGPGGAALAYTLARRGITVTLVERHTDFEREFRGEWLSPSGRIALTEMGLGEVLAGVPQMSPGGATIFVGGREQFTVRPNKPPGDNDHLLVKQPALLAGIVEAARQFPSFTFVNGAVVRDVVRDETGRITGITGTRADSPFELQADLVIGADGRASALRRASGLTAAVDNAGQFDMVWFKAPLPPGLDETLGYQFLQRGGTAFTHPHPDGVHQYGWAFSKGTYGELRKQGRSAWLEAMKAHVPEPFATHLGTMDDVDAVFLEIVSNHLSQWYVPGLLLIGDAAHPMSAVGGQGINMALRDAVVTANHLGPILLRGAVDPSTIDAAAALVAPERLPEIAKIQTMQERGSRILNLQTKPAQFMMERIVPMLGKRAAPILARGVGTTKAFSKGVTTVRLTF